jgi:NADPH:quinone reductase-like Zn-dependent oxidoreductase
VKAGQRVLIHAGAGGVGTFAVQLAKARGAHVITTAGPRNKDFVIKVLVV